MTETGFWLCVGTRTAGVPLHARTRGAVLLCCFFGWRGSSGSRSSSWHGWWIEWVPWGLPCCFLSNWVSCSSFLPAVASSIRGSSEDSDNCASHPTNQARNRRGAAYRRHEQGVVNWKEFRTICGTRTITSPDRRSSSSNWPIILSTWRRNSGGTTDKDFRTLCRHFKHQLLQKKLT